MISEPRMTRQQVRVDLKARFPYSNNADIAETRRGVMRRLNADRQREIDLLPENNPGVLSTDHRERVGQTVTWTSSNMEKTGEIVAVVPPGEHPSTDLTPKVKDPGAPRDHDSYVVKANGKHYWPRVSLLSIGGA